jgi:hypothetical protein
MRDDELVEALRQTFREQADSIRPRAGTLPSPPSRPRRVPRPGRRLALASLATALAAGTAAAIVALNDHPNQAHNVSIAGQASTVPVTPTPHQVAPSSVPPSSPGPTSSEPAVTTPSTPVPPGFRALSVTFVSARTGWVLGTAPCGRSQCTTLARTTDGGYTWSQVSQPPMTLTTPGNGGVSIRFYDLNVGWIVAPAGPQGSALWTTRNGGKDWTEEPNPGGPSATVEALEASNGLVHLVDLAPGKGVDQIFTSPVSQDSWAPARTAPSFGGGPVPSSQIVLFGPAGWIVNVNRTVIGGARFDPANGWTTWTPPCSDAHGSGFLAASSTSDLYAICDEGVWGSPAAGTAANSQWLYLSTNGGISFSAVGPVRGGTIQGGAPGGVMAAAAGTATVEEAGSSGIIATFDGGKSWETVSGAAGITYLGFTTATQGVAISQGTNSSGLLMTHDGGHTWVSTTF